MDRRLGRGQTDLNATGFLDGLLGRSKGGRRGLRLDQRAGKDA
jgi:hypothetical protein